MISAEAGGPGSVVITEIPSPEPGFGEVRVAVRACGVNYPDVLFVADRYQIRVPRPFSPGGEVAGVIDAIGPGVNGIECGERVAAVTGWGGMAEQVVVPADRVIPLPDEVPFEQAATLLFSYGTAWHALKSCADLQPGDSLIVLGAAGGVGTAAIQVGCLLGAAVVAATSSREKASAAQLAGARQSVVYPRGPLDSSAAQGLRDQLRQAAGGSGAAVVFDPVGGDYTEPAFRALREGGQYLTVGFTAGIPSLPLNIVLLKSARLFGVNWRQFVMESPSEHVHDATHLFDLCAEGQLNPAISRRFALEDAGAAMHLVDSRAAVGKIVISIEG
ncbi:NADPH:quinone oxidoreductase family protein [Mycobacterium marseillense]|uniref:NADPH:quinone oxidoreductase family protein n=1 Tax=Mycobacterium marseillense TaxID=701042 RepID=UPI0025947B3B|nr:NADPH:quinone oxidoreductase family protein [Mycobacterium marseillense]MDM3975294.1 NADPH:quinone oxidoreductase family protein [Mycobacterium marseillense]